MKFQIKNSFKRIFLIWHKLFKECKGFIAVDLMIASLLILILLGIYFYTLSAVENSKIHQTTIAARYLMFGEYNKFMYEITANPQKVYGDIHTTTRELNGIKYAIVTKITHDNNGRQYIGVYINWVYHQKLYKDQYYAEIYPLPMLTAPAK